MLVTNDFMEAVLDELMVRWDICDIPQKRFAKVWSIPEATFSTLKTKYEKGHKGYSSLLSNSKWLGLGRALGVYVRQRKWNVVETSVYKKLHEEMMFCKEESRSMICVIDADMGKTETAKAICAKQSGAYYVDCSRAKSRPEFIRLLARSIGSDYKKLSIQEIFDQVVYDLMHNDRPLVVLDEFGDLSDAAFLEIKALWNATEHACGWYAMGADGLRTKLERGFTNKKLGVAEFLRRFGGKFSTMPYKSADHKLAVTREIITQVLQANMQPEEMKYLDRIVNQCLNNDGQERMGCLTRAESLLILYKRQAENKAAKLNEVN